MAILIEGINIPEGNPITINIYRDGTWVNAYTTEDGNAIEVPEPHGRLGDLDALMLIIREYIDEYGELDENGFHSEKWCAMKEAEMVISEAPTIIPASEEG